LLPRTYLEIGVFEGKSLALVLPCTTAVGVDPEPHIKYAVDPRSRVVATTSDEFFDKEITGTALHELVVDVSFLDGLHHFEAVLRDFMNAERLSSPNSVILIHDVHPSSARAASRSHLGGHWAGDVWKLMFALEAHRPDLVMHIVDVPPTGLGIVTNLNPYSTVLAAHYHEIVTRFMPLEYETIRADAERRLRLVPDDWRSIAALLPRPYQMGDRLQLRSRRSLRFPPRLSHIPGETERRLGLSPLGYPLRRFKERLRGVKTVRGRRG
jgi:hypothetical protein